MRRGSSVNAIADQLKAVPLFRGASPKQRKTMAKLGKVLEWKAGTTPITQGSRGAAFFLIIDGSIEVVRDGQSVARLGTGEFVGELALLTNSDRNADVRAHSDTTVFAFSRTALVAALKTEPGIALALLEAMAERMRATQ